MRDWGQGQGSSPNGGSVKFVRLFFRNLTQRKHSTDPDLGVQTVVCTGTGSEMK